MKMTLNELRTIIKRIIKEEKEEKFETKPVRNHGADAKKIPILQSTKLPMPSQPCGTIAICILRNQCLLRTKTTKEL
jgi:hypothetical protein